MVFHRLQLYREYVTRINLFLLVKIRFGKCTCFISNVNQLNLMINVRLQICEFEIIYCVDDEFHKS